MAHKWIICNGIGEELGKPARDDTVLQTAVTIPIPEEQGGGNYWNL